MAPGCVAGYGAGHSAHNEAVVIGLKRSGHGEGRGVGGNIQRKSRRGTSRDNSSWCSYHAGDAKCHVVAVRVRERLPEKEGCRRLKRRSGVD
jgi:hypothetical protein